MTTARLRELMDERVADVEGRDLAARAWARADGVRRRRRYAVTGAAAATVLVVAGGVAVLDDRTDSDVQPSSRPTSTPTESPSPSPTLDDRAPQAVLSGKFRGAPFWWAPPAEKDVELPVLQVPGLPETLSMADEDPVATPPDHVEAVFGTAKQQYRLLTNGQFVSVDLSDRLGPVGDEAGNMFNPLGPVSPDGSEVIFRQPGRVEIWNLPTDTWRTFETADYEQAAWTRDGRLWLPGDGEIGRPDPWTGDNQYSHVVVGPAGAAELDWTTGDPEVPGARGPGRYANPEILVAGPAGDLSVLGIGVDGRSKGCCSLIGWFSHDFVLFGASSSGSYRVLVWRVGTPDLYRVSEFTDFPRQGAAMSWAEDAFSSFGP